MAEPQQASTGVPRRRPRTKIRPDLGNDEVADHAFRWRSRFLDTLGETSNVRAAAAAAGVHASRAYRTRRMEPHFARKWRTALLDGYEHLELEVLHRLRFGEPKDGAVKFDNAGALRLLALHRETVSRERAMRENEDVEMVRTAIDAKLEQLRREIAARRQRERDGEQGQEAANHG